MKITAIVAEYNPFHHGHAHHLSATRAETGGKILALMSGNFVQRGEPALLDKWARTRMALNGGADLVLELPAVYATASAEYFAAGAVRILNSLDCVDFLSFGAEAGDLSPLLGIVKRLSSRDPLLEEELKTRLKSGMSYAAARQAALARTMGKEQAACVKQANNILAVEYLKALHKTSSPITPLCVKREGADYTSADMAGRYPSALAIRGALKAGHPGWQSAVPPGNISLFTDMVYEDALFLPLLHRLRSLSKEEIAACRYVSEGLENRIAEGAGRCTGYEELLAFVASKRYPLTRVKRIFLSILLGLTKEKEKTLMDSPPYARVLGVKKESMDMLSHIASLSRIPVLTSPLQLEGDSSSLRFDAYASDIYALFSHPVSPAGRDYREKFIVSR